MEYVLQTNAVKKDYGKYKALNGLTMHVPKGSIYGFVGKRFEHHKNECGRASRKSRYGVEFFFFHFGGSSERIE